MYLIDIKGLPKGFYEKNIFTNFMPKFIKINDQIFYQKLFFDRP